MSGNRGWCFHADSGVHSMAWCTLDGEMLGYRAHRLVKMMSTFHVKSCIFRGSSVLAYGTSYVLHTSFTKDQKKMDW